MSLLLTILFSKKTYVIVIWLLEIYLFGLVYDFIVNDPDRYWVITALFLHILIMKMILTSLVNVFLLLESKKVSLLRIIFTPLKLISYWYTFRSIYILFNGRTKKN